MNRRLAVLAAAAVLAGCAQISQVASGDVTLRDRLVVTVDKPWNQFDRGTGDNVPTWTQDGVTVDTLRFYVGLKDGELLAPTPPKPEGQKPLAFKANMQTAEIVALFEAMYSRGGSTFKLDKVGPHSFVGAQGFRFDFSSIRKADDVRLTGVGWGAVRNGELFVVTYTAPRLAFFPQHIKSAENIARSARVR